jgi:hypothetical protein
MARLAALALVLTVAVGCGDGSDDPAVTPTATPTRPISFPLPTQGSEAPICVDTRTGTVVPCSTPTPDLFCDGRPCGTPSPWIFPTDRYGGMGCVVLGQGQVACPTPTASN